MKQILTHAFFLFVTVISVAEPLLAAKTGFVKNLKKPLKSPEGKSLAEALPTELWWKVIEEGALSSNDRSALARVSRTMNRQVTNLQKDLRDRNKVAVNAYLLDHTAVNKIPEAPNMTGHFNVGWTNPYAHSLELTRNSIKQLRKLYPDIEFFRSRDRNHLLIKGFPHSNGTHQLFPEIQVRRVQRNQIEEGLLKEVEWFHFLRSEAPDLRSLEPFNVPSHNPSK